MTEADDNGEARERPAGDPARPVVAEPSGLLISRRVALFGGALGLAAVAGVSEVDPQIALASTPPLTDSIPQPKTTAPEQLRLAWGADPSTEVTISWSAPGSVQMPAPTLAYSSEPIGPTNPGSLVRLPAMVPLSLAAPRTGPSSTSFTDNLSNETSYHYHVPLTGLTPNTRYFYAVSDGASPPSTASGEFMTAPTGRAAYRFTAFGDIGTPYSGNPSTYTWKESSDTSIYTLDGVISPADQDGPGLFHLMLADLAYANVNPGNTVAIWRDYQTNASRAAQNQPWMPIQGNHEVELGLSDSQGTPTSGDYYNGPYGAGNYLARHLLPDNGLTNHDGNSLQGSFYSFTVGTVLFVCLNTNDVVYQNPQTVSTPSSSYSGTYAGGTIPGGTVGVSQYLSTGGFVANGSNLELVPDTTTPASTPNLQTQWLAGQLAAARTEGSGVDMIVVCEHHCALSSGPNNGVDLAIRAAWLPLYDEYEVDLVIGGHDHDYERSYPVRGYDAVAAGTTTAAFTNPFGSFAAGASINTRRPTVVSTEPTQLGNGMAAWNTAAGTVFLQLGGAGAAGGPLPKTDPTTGLREAVVWATDGGVNANQCATEVATWSASYDTSDNYGYAVFDVDPGSAPGETTLTYRWYQVPAVANGGTEAMSTAPFEEFVFTRFMPTGQVSIGGAPDGVAQAGQALASELSGWPAGSTFAYQWLLDGVAIPGATLASYTPTAAEDGDQIAVAVTVTAQSYPAATRISSAASVATPAPSAEPRLSLGAPTITGTPRVGAVLRADVVASTPGAQMDYAWQRNGRAISGATASAYRLVPADGGTAISVKVTESVVEYVPVFAVSAAVTIPAERFARTHRPLIRGAALVGHTVTAEVAGWTPAADLAFQWLLDATPIRGATRRSLRLEPADRGRRLTVRVTGRRSGYVTEHLTSAAVVVASTALHPRRPQILGRALVGETLHARLGEWPAGTEFSYRWYVGGRLAPEVTGHAFRVRAEHRGKRVSLEVTGHLPGHGAAPARSAPTRVIRRPWTLL